MQPDFGDELRERISEGVNSSNQGQSGLEIEGIQKMIREEQDSLQQSPKTSGGAWRLLNDSKTASIIESGVLRKLGYGVSKEAFKFHVDNLEKSLLKITQYVVSHLELKGIATPMDDNDWSMNKLRADWAKRLTDSWESEGEEGIKGLFNQVPAIVELGLKRSKDLSNLSSEPYLLSENLSLQLTMDKVAAKSLDLILVAGERFNSTHVVNSMVSDITKLSVGMRDKILQEANEQAVPSNIKNALLQNCFSRILFSYEEAFKRVSKNNNQTPSNVLRETYLNVQHNLEISSKLKETIKSEIKPSSRTQSE